VKPAFTSEARADVQSRAAPSPDLRGATRARQAMVRPVPPPGEGFRWRWARIAITPARETPLSARTGPVRQGSSEGGARAAPFDPSH